MPPPTYPRALYQTPKKPTTSREPTVEEWAEFGKALYHLRLDLIALKMATVEKHREIDNLFNSVRARRDPSTIEPCGLCGLSHLGNCNA